MPKISVVFSYFFLLVSLEVSIRIVLFYLFIYLIWVTLLFRLSC